MPRDMSSISECCIELQESGSGYGSLVVYMHIGVGSALLVSINWAMREPSIVRRVTGTGSHVLSFYIGIYIAESGELIGKQRRTEIFH